MLVSLDNLLGTVVLSMQASGPIANVTRAILDPDSLKIVAFKVGGPLVTEANILDVRSIREYSQFGMVVDSIEDFSAPDDIIKLNKILELNFDLVGLKVETKKGSRLGKITGYTVTSDNFSVQQLIVKRPLLKSFLDPELIIPRSEIVEITDYKVIVRDEEKTIAKKAATEDFIPNFVNPFRSTKPVSVRAETDPSEAEELGGSSV